VDVNDQAAKPSKAVRPGDRLGITPGWAAGAPESPRSTTARPGGAGRLYEDLTPPEPPRTRQAPPPYRPPGAGRPTKRERRDIQRLRGR
jgi:ribosome-associated heat shock protein Hsp15